MSKGGKRARDLLMVAVDPLGERFVLPGGEGEITIGRSPRNDIVIAHESISRSHAVIAVSGGRFQVRDNGSKNGVMVNGELIDGSAKIHAGDELRFGEVAFTLQEGVGCDTISLLTVQEATNRSSRLEMLIEMSKLINSSLVLTEVLDRVMDAVMEITLARRGYLMITGDDGELAVKVARSSEESSVDEDSFQISMSTVNRVFSDGISVVSIDTGSDSVLSAQLSVIKLGLKSIMCVPLKHRQETLGVIYVDSYSVSRGFSDEDLEIFESLAGHAAIAISNARLVEENKEMFFSTIEALAEAIEKRDRYTGGHTQRVLRLSQEIADEMNLSGEEKDTLKMAALLHDVGKIGVEDAVLRKEAPLDDREFGMIKKHPQIGAEIVGHIRRLQDVLPGILLHHEKVDGRGYPFGYSQSEIPLQARIIAVADSVDAMMTDRPYRKGLPFDKVISELEENRDKQFDSAVVDAVRRVFEKSTGLYGAAPGSG